MVRTVPVLRSIVWAVPAGWILLNLITLRWEQGPDYAPPMWGFPLPWVWWPGVSSLHWHVCVPALFTNLIVYSLPVMLSMRLVQHRLSALSRIVVFLAGGLLALATLFFAIQWLFLGHTLGVAVPVENVTAVSWCVFPNCYKTH